MGSHRVGKTSLARAYAEKNGATFVETSVSAIFKDLGLDPADTFSFSERLDIQEVVLDRVDAIYGALPLPGYYITDRTPLDMLAYTLAEATGDAVSDADQERLAKYTRRCFDVTNRRFTTLVLIQPGIPLVYEEGKAALNVAYIEHLSALCLGLSVDERVKPSHFYLPRGSLDMDSRVRALENATMKACYHEVAAYKEHIAAGKPLM